MLLGIICSIYKICSICIICSICKICRICGIRLICSICCIIKICIVCCISQIFCNIWRWNVCLIRRRWWWIRVTWSVIVYNAQFPNSCWISCTPNTYHLQLTCKVENTTLVSCPPNTNSTRKSAVLCFNYNLCNASCGVVNF